MTTWDDKLTELIRKGDMQKVSYFKKLDDIILPSVKKRIQQGDKTVLREIVLPEWMKWETLYEWATHKVVTENIKHCVLCNENTQNHFNFKGKTICTECFNDIKNIQQSTAQSLE